MRSLTLLPLVAAMLLAPSSAGAATSSSDDWRVLACTDPGTVEEPPSGRGSVVASSRVPVDGLPGVMVGVDRLAFTDATCEVLYVDGVLPRGASVKVVRNSWCASFDHALDGQEAGSSTDCASAAGPVRLYTGGAYGEPDDVQVLARETFRGHDERVLSEEPDAPPEYSGSTVTTTHAGSSWTVTLAGTTTVRRAFDRSRATDRAARAAYAKRVVRATRAFEQRVAEIEGTRAPRAWKARKIDQAAQVRREALALARKQQRLALDGFRLVRAEFRSSSEGTLPPVA